MPIIITLILVLLGFTSGEIEIGLALGLVVGLFLLRRESRQQAQTFKQQIDKLKSAEYEEDEFSLDMPDQAEKAEQPVETATPGLASKIPTQSEKTTPTPVSTEPVREDFKTESPGNRFIDQIDDLMQKVQKVIWSYFTDGNIFVRVGLLILFFGVAFLLKYAAENSSIPLELRFLGAAAGGLFLLIMGWRLRHKKALYALLLQGGGIGIIYITIFASYRLAGLIPSTLTFTLLVLFAVLSAALAVLQNSRALMIFALLGGFLAPFLASSGSGNYIGLFSYYALLNLSIFIVAWYKSWRPLNVLGFVFTFAIYILWYFTSYKPEFLYPASGFLLLFFLMYSVLGIVYALRQKQNLKGLVDGTLVFGTPVIASSLLMAMLRQTDYGIAITCALLGLYYVGLARFLWQRQGDQLRLMSEALLAIGVVFATLAIPYSLDGHWSSATWALEAAGILWVSIRQQRVYAQWFAIALQVGAGLLFVARNADDVGTTVWLNPSFLGGVFIALGAFISARLLYQLESSNKMHRLHGLFFVWAMLWWLASSLVQIVEYLEHIIASIVILLTLTALVMTYLDRIRAWNWTPASISAAALLPGLIVMALLSLADNEHLWVYPDVLAWLVALVVNYWIVEKLESIEWPANTFIGLHVVLLVFVCLVLAQELTWAFYEWLPATGEGFIAVATIIPLLFMYGSRTAGFPAIVRFGLPLQMSLSASLAVLMLLWSLVVNMTNTADPSPLPYLPFFNPLDLAHIVLFISVLRFLPLLQPKPPEYRNTLIIAVGGLAFIWLSALLLRSMHHYADIPFDISSMLMNVKIHTALSILWTVLGMFTMLVAAKKQIRALWIAAAVLVVVVLIKMFFIDLGASGTVERIVSFLVVGGLLVAMGYFSPIPQKQDEQVVN